MPPKKKGSGKKKKALPMTLDGLNMVDMSLEQVKELSVRFQEQLQIETEERDLLFRQMDNIDAAGKIAERQLEETKAELQNLEKKLEDDERHNEVKVMVEQKMNHILHEHLNVMAELEAELASTVVLQEEQEQSEGELHEETSDLQTLDYEKMKKFEKKLEEEQTESRDNLEKKISEIKSLYEEKFKSFEQALTDMGKKILKEREDQWRSHIDLLQKNHHAAYNEAWRLIDPMEFQTTELRFENEILRFLNRQSKTNKERSVALDQNERSLTERLQEVKEEIAKTDGKIQICEKRIEKRAKLHKHHEKHLNDLKQQYKDLEQKFSKLQLEREDESEKHCEAMQRAQREADLQISLRQKTLKALTENLEEIQAQRRSVLCSCNTDQTTALAGITKTIEENLDSCNKSVKNLKDKKAQISKAHKDLRQSFEAKQSVSGERP